MFYKCDDRAGVIPNSIPNLEVKSCIADDSWVATPCESKTSHKS